eukprot:jgi/Psemu1/33262/gm1.33262_g
MAQTIPPKKSNKVAPAPQTRSAAPAPAPQVLRSRTRPSSTNARTAAAEAATTTTTRRRSVAARNSSLCKNPYNKKKNPPPPPSGSPATTAGKRKKKRARRPLPLSAPPPVASLAPVACPSAAANLVDHSVAPAAPLMPDRPVPLVGPAAPLMLDPIDPSSVAPVAPSMPDPVDPLAPVAPEDNSSDDSSTTLSDSDSDATTIQDYSRDLGIAVEQLHLPPAVTFFVPTALACNNIEATTPAPLPQEFTLASILTALEGNKLSLRPNTEKIKGLTFNTTAHKKKKKRFLAEFFQSLAAHPQAGPLAELIPDPETPSLMKHRFFIQCCALLSPNKLALLNYCMLIYSMNLYKVIYHNMDLSKDAGLYADAQYHPNSVNQWMKSTDFDHPGGFQAYWKKNFAITSEHRKSYGKLPNKAQFDPKWFTKRWEAVWDPKNPLDPFNNMEHYVWCAMENIMTKWATRGCKEPAPLVKEDFETGLIQEGEFAGIPFVQLKETYSGQKNCALSLKHHVIDEENTRKRTLPCPYSSDALSTYQTTIKLLSMVPDDCQNSNRIFRKPASKKQIKASSMNFWVQIAIWSGYDNSERCTAHEKRHETLAKVANASVCPSLIKGVGGHASIDITTRYIKPNQQAIDAAVCAKHGSPSKIAPRAPSPAPAPAPASPLEETQAPAPFLDESPLLSIQHSFGDRSKDSVSSDFATGALGLMTQQFEVPKKFPLAFPSNISLGTGEEPFPPHYKDRGQFAEDRPQNEDYDHHSRLQYEHYNWYEPLYKGEPPRPPPPCTQSYKRRYEEECKPHPQDPRCVSFGENRSYYYEPRYKEERKLPPRQSYKPRYKEECKPPPCQPGSHARRPPSQAHPPPQHPCRVSFGENNYHRYDEQNGAWGPSPVEVFSGYPPSIGRPSFASTDPEVQVTSVVHQIASVTSKQQEAEADSKMNQPGTSMEHKHKHNENEGEAEERRVATRNSPCSYLEVEAGGDVTGKTPKRRVEQFYRKICEKTPEDRNRIETVLLRRKETCRGPCLKVDKAATKLEKKKSSPNNKHNIINNYYNYYAGTCVLCGKNDVRYFCLGCHAYFCRFNSIDKDTKRIARVKLPNSNQLVYTQLDCYLYCHPLILGRQKPFDEFEPAVVVARAKKIRRNDQSSTNAAPAPRRSGSAAVAPTRGLDP